MMKLLHDTQSILSRPKEAYFKREVKVEKAIKSEYLKAKEKGKTSMKKTFSFGHCPNEGGGLPMPEFFGPLFRSAFLVNKKSLFLQKCQCIELLTVFRLHINSILYSTYSILSSKLTFKS